MLNIIIISYKIIVKNIILKGGSTMKKILLVLMIIFPIFYFSSYKMEEKKDILYGESVPLTKSFQQEKSQDKTIPINTLTVNSMKEFFMSLNENIGFNAYGSCGIVGIAMLLSYYDSFWDDTIIQERYDQKEQLSYLSTRIVSEQSPGITGDKELFLNDYNEKISLYGRYMFSNYRDLIEQNCLKYFHFYLLDIALNSSYINVYHSNNSFTLGMNYNQVYQLIKDYLVWSDLGVSIESNYDRRMTAKSHAIEMIRSGTPVLMGISDEYGNGHIVVAYDYNEEQDIIYFNSGLEDYGSYSELSYMGYSNFNFTIAITSLEEHTCSDNYFYRDDSYCPCDFFSIYPSHLHRYKLYQKLNLSKHYELCLCSARIQNVHTINTKDYIRKDGRLYSNCLYCYQLLEINLDGPIQGMLTYTVLIDKNKWEELL